MCVFSSPKRENQIITLLLPQKLQPNSWGSLWCCWVFLLIWGVTSSLCSPPSVSSSFWLKFNRTMGMITEEHSPTVLLSSPHLTSLHSSLCALHIRLKTELFEIDKLFLRRLHISWWIITPGPGVWPLTLQQRFLDFVFTETFFLNYSCDKHLIFVWSSVKLFGFFKQSHRMEICIHSFKVNKWF